MRSTTIGSQRVVEALRTLAVALSCRPGSLLGKVRDGLPWWWGVAQTFLAPKLGAAQPFDRLLGALPGTLDGTHGAAIGALGGVDLTLSTCDFVAAVERAASAIEAGEQRGRWDAGLAPERWLRVVESELSHAALWAQGAAARRTTGTSGEQLWVSPDKRCGGAP